MDAEDWIPEEQIKELHRTIRARNFTTALIYVASVISVFLSIRPLESGNLSYALTFQILGVVLFLYTIHMISKTLEHKHHMTILIEKQENDLKNETVRMLAQIEVILGEDDRND